MTGSGAAITRLIPRVGGGYAVRQRLSHVACDILHNIGAECCMAAAHSGEAKWVRVPREHVADCCTTVPQTAAWQWSRPLQDSGEVGCSFSVAERCMATQ